MMTKWNYLIEDDDSHDLALDDDDPALVVDADSARMLQDVRAEFTDELAVLVVDLNLKFRFKRKSYIVIYLSVKVSKYFKVT